jgi:hypothetical protein
MMRIEFGEYLPDLPALNNPGLVQAKNVIPGGKSYLEFPSQVVYSNALTARCQGAVSTKDRDGNSVNFAGDATKLYKSTTATYADVSLVGGYTTSTEENWHFTRFGDRLIATNFADYPQTFTLASSSNFANLTTDLKARYCATIKSFLVFGNTFDASDGNVPHRVRWSALDDPTDFTVSPTTQSDYQDLNAEYGWVRQVVGGEYGVIFQERAISRMDYVGSPVIWNIEPVELGRGTQSPYSVVKVGNIIFYLGLDGFYAFDGNTSTPIGENRINRTFFSEVDLSYLPRVYGTADLDKQIIYWAYPASGNTSGRANKILCYNYSPNATKRWSYIDNLDLEFLYTSLSEGYTLDGLDSLGYNLDTLPYSLDSRVWTGENFILSGFNSDHKQVNFTGTALTALLETGDIQLTPGQRTNLLRARPLVEGTSATATLNVGTRNNLTESVTYGNTLSVDSIGEFQMRSNSRYHRARLNVSGGFDHASGVEVLELEAAGNR